MQYIFTYDLHWLILTLEIFFFNFVAVTATTPTAFPTGSTFAPVPGCKSFSYTELLF